MSGRQDVLRLVPWLLVSVLLIVGFVDLRNQVQDIGPRVEDLVKEIRVSTLTTTYSGQDGKTHTVTTVQQTHEEFADLLDRHEYEVEQMQEKFPEA